MPLYEYRCKKCGHEFEELQKIGDPQPRSCPKCRGRVEKKVSAAGFQLKGAGWYKDGYQKPTAKPSEHAVLPETTAPQGTAGSASKGTAAPLGAAATVPKDDSAKPAASTAQGTAVPRGTATTKKPLSKTAD